MMQVKSETRLSGSDDSEKKELQANNNQSMNRMFQFLWIGLIILLTPYLYFAHLINTYGQQNAPKEFDFPKYKDLLPAITSIFVIGLMQKSLLQVSTNFYDPIVKGQNEPELK